MIIIGHPWIESQKFKKVHSEVDISKTTPNDIVLLEPLSKSYKLAQYCQKNHIPFSVNVNKLTDAIFANALGAMYIVCEEEDALLIQPIAQEYLFDTRVLVLIDNEEEIEKIARASIDGIIFREIINEI